LNEVKSRIVMGFENLE